jgi:leucyl aminopeptidase (aminopeptidase T)
MKDGLKKAAYIALDTCLGVKKNESVLIITDEPLRPIGMVFWEVARKMCHETIFTEIMPREIHGTEPPSAVAKMMSEVDVIIIPTSKSLTHTQARRNATIKGARCASLPGISEKIMVRTFLANYKKIAKLTKKVAKILTDGKEVHITTLYGTDIKFSIKDRKGYADTGILTSPGSFGNLPAGEACIAPVEESASGKLVIDGSLGGIGILKQPIQCYVEGGYVTKINGGEEGKKLEKILERYGTLARNIAEFGIGTHDKAKLSGIVLEDEKVKGTIHIAIGDNQSYGGVVKVPIHLDGVILNPTVKVDNRIIIKRGKFVI